MKLGLEKQNLFLISCFGDLIFYFVYFFLTSGMFSGYEALKHENLALSLFLIDLESLATLRPNLEVESD